MSAVLGVVNVIILAVSLGAIVSGLPIAVVAHEPDTVTQVGLE